MLPLVAGLSCTSCSFLFFSAIRFFSCPPLAARHSLFQLPTPCSSPFAFSAAHSLQLAMHFFSCPPLAARHSLFQLPARCSSPRSFSAAHLAARHAFFQLLTPCSSPFALSAPTPCSSPCAFSVAHPLQLAVRFFSCPPLLRRCPPRSSQPRPGLTSLPALQLTAASRLQVAARPPAHQRAAPQLHVAALPMLLEPRPHVAARSAAPQHHLSSHCCAPRSSQPAQLNFAVRGVAYKRACALQLTAEPRIHDAARAAHQQHLTCMLLPAPQLTAASRPCPPRRSQPHLGFTSLRAQQLTASPRLHPGYTSLSAP